MRKGVTRADPSRFDLRGELACGHDVSIDVNCNFEGKVSLADDVRIVAGTMIAPYSHLDGAVVGKHCRGRLIVFIDESGISERPTCVRTGALKSHL